MTGLNKFSCLETLILDKNDLSDIKSCPVIKTLHTLWCNNNQISDMEEFMNDVVARFHNLRYLSLMRNPCSPGLLDISQPDLEACRLYRSYVLYRLPSLRVLDCADVTKEVYL
jgi:Leucine-rich repeat (LRR) protein